MENINILRIMNDVVTHLSEDITDKDALDVKGLFYTWAANTDYIIGDRRIHESVLYKARQNHTSQEHYTPDITPALWEVVAPEGKGDSPDNPIEYNQNMAIIEGKFYIENDVVYLCIRDSGVPLYTALANVVGNYVEVYVGN